MRTLANSTTARPTKQPDKQIIRLTLRETEVGHWLSRGKTNREIAFLIHASPRTIDKHVEHILAKLCVENRTTAALILRP
jgi:DNA-binding NarL/FixJ family response regulator